MADIGVVGAGFSGAVIAFELAHAGHNVTVFDSRSHIGGNCHTVRDSQSGILVHKYGPHIFHTNNERVWRFVQQFDEFMGFTNRVKAIHNGRVYSLPINLLTINAFFDKTFNPKQAEVFLRSVADKSISMPKNFEEQALSMIGQDLYEAFFKGYTMKQWGIDPKDLPASILKRLPVRFNYNDSYYDSKFQGIPKNGYTYIIERMLDNPSISVRLNCLFSRNNALDFDHIFYSGPIDAWFEYSLGRLRYRTLDFVLERHVGDYQGNAVINYGNLDVPYTRISEHKHFSPWEQYEDTLIYKEYSRFCGPGDIPYYPIRLVEEKNQLKSYIEMANREKNVTFVGRLGTYRYLDMHITIEEALLVASQFVLSRQHGTKMAAFCVDPLA